jgi:hypothetical protein
LPGLCVKYIFVAWLVYSVAMPHDGFLVQDAAVIDFFLPPSSLAYMKFISSVQRRGKRCSNACQGNPNFAFVLSSPFVCRLPEEVDIWTQFFFALHTCRFLDPQLDIGSKFLLYILQLSITKGYKSQRFAHMQK